jgi:hypothetical protein
MSDESAPKPTPAAPPPVSGPSQTQSSPSTPPPNPPIAAAPHLVNLLERGVPGKPSHGQPVEVPSNKLANRIDLGDPPRGRTLTGEGQPPDKKRK